MNIEVRMVKAEHYLVSWGTSEKEFTELFSCETFLVTERRDVTATIMRLATGSKYIVYCNVFDFHSEKLEL